MSHLFDAPAPAPAPVANRKARVMLNDNAGTQAAAIMARLFAPLEPWQDECLCSMDGLHQWIGRKGGAICRLCAVRRH